MSTKKKIIISVLFFIVLIIVYVLLDYNNILSKNSIKVSLINVEFFSIFISNLIVILLYLITYFLIDEKNVKERKNKKEISIYKIEYDYNVCLRYLNILDDKEQLKLVVERIRKDKQQLMDDEYFNSWMENSFRNYNDIIQYSNEGIVNLKVFEKYIKIKNEYTNLMMGYVLFDAFPDGAVKLIQEGHQNLKEMIKKELENIEALKIKD